MRTLLFTFIVTFYSLLSFAQQFQLEATLEKRIRAIFDIDGDGICEYIADTNKVYDGFTHDLKYTFPAGSYLDWDNAHELVNPGGHWKHTDYNLDGKRDLIINQDDTFMVFDVVNNAILFELSHPGESIHFENLIDIDGDSGVELVLTAYISSNIYKTYIYSTPIITSVLGESNVHSPKEYRLKQNFPNPFNPSTTIRYSITSPEYVSIKVYDVSGQLVKEITKDHNQAGEYEVVWDGKNKFGKRVSSGTYFYQLSVGDYVEAKKMILLK